MQTDGQTGFRPPRGVKLFVRIEAHLGRDSQGGACIRAWSRFTVDAHGEEAVCTRLSLSLSLSFIQGGEPRRRRGAAAQEHRSAAVRRGAALNEMKKKKKHEERTESRLVHERLAVTPCFYPHTRRTLCRLFSFEMTANRWCPLHIEEYSSALICLDYINRKLEEKRNFRLYSRLSFEYRKLISGKTCIK